MGLSFLYVGGRKGGVEGCATHEVFLPGLFVGGVGFLFLAGAKAHYRDAEHTHAARQGVHGPIRRFDFKFFIAVYGAAAGLDIAGLQASALRFAKKLSGWGVGVELAAVPIEQNKPQARNVHGLKHDMVF